MHRNVIPVDRRSTFVRKLRGDALTVTHASFPAFASDQHAHERAMCTLVLAGEWVQQFRGRSYRCGPGTLLAKDAQETHTDRFDAAGTELLLIELPVEQAPHLDSCVRRLLDVRCVTGVDLRPLAYRLVGELDDPDELSPVVAEGLSLELLGTSASRHASRHRSRPPAWANRARELFLAALDRPLRVVDVARALEVHPVHLARTFRAHFGTSPGTFMRRARLDRAARELATTDRPLAEIAQWAGFGDQSHFTRAFKRYVGMTPGRYRRVVRPQNQRRSVL